MLLRRWLFRFLLATSVLTGAVWAAPAPATDADTEWQAVLALDAGPRLPIASRDEARAVGLAHLARQESALRQFLTDHPGDPRAVDAVLRLAHLLTTQSDLKENAAPYAEAVKLLDRAAQTAPEARRADVAFAQIALAMHRAAASPTDGDRVALTNRMARFQKYYPNDRRLAPLIAEIATLYDEQPKHKALLLRQALEAARDENTRARVLDDLKRLELLGHPLVIDGTTAEGTPVTTAEAQGKVVAVYFFASWSPPSVAGLEEVAYLRQTFPPEQLEVIGVSLDPTRESLEKLTKAHPFLGLVIWDGKGWESPLIRRLALNALPTLWILDRKGNLRTLNARTESEALIRRLLKEQP